MIDLSDFNHITQATLTFDDNKGIRAALREAQYSMHTTQVGAVVNGVSAFNSPVDCDGERYHAESLSIVNCARVGAKTYGATMYCTWAACPECAADILASGISRVVVPVQVMNKTYGKYLTSVEQGLGLLYRHRIRVDVVDTDEGYFGFDIRMDGKVVKV